MSKIEQKLEKIKQIYEDYGYPNINRMKDILKRENISITNELLQSFYYKNKTAQLHKRPPPNKKGYPIVSTNTNMIFQMDLLDFQKFAHSNNNYKWILIAIDVFTRKAYAQPIKTKSADDTLQGMKKIFDVSGFPKKLYTDQGKEYKGGVKKYLDDNKVIHIVNDLHDHRVLGVVDAFSKTIKQMLYKHMTNTESTRWIDVLNKFINNYNNTKHATINMTPNEAEKRPSDTLKAHYERVKDIIKKQSFNIGDTVRVLKERRIFDKGYAMKWREKPQKITAQEGLYYILDDGNRYRGDRLQKIHKDSVVHNDKIKEVDKERKIQRELNKEGVEKENIIQFAPVIPQNEVNRPKRNRKQVDTGFMVRQ